MRGLSPSQAKRTSALYISNRSTVCSYETRHQSQSLNKEFLLLFCFTCLESRIPRPHASCCLGTGCICRCRYNDRPPAKSHHAETAGLGLAGAVFVDLRLAGAKSVGIVIGSCWNCRHEDQSDVYVLKLSLGCEYFWDHQPYEQTWLLRCLAECVQSWPQYGNCAAQRKERHRSGTWPERRSGHAWLC